MRRGAGSRCLTSRQKTRAFTRKNQGRWSGKNLWDHPWLRYPRTWKRGRLRKKKIKKKTKRAMWS
ncbi:hypothetical protein B0T14DRAFT_526218 [Immersiella caudata]|uniref:Uncharacterized protein n=1 Tax=Immersiella caudata TaxID=314043 RepID=A0AA39WDJ7_9PEZI|nr:hypothetical protein B0T14DRAFT_526218 [Immersiella caudata]